MVATVHKLPTARAERVFPDTAEGRLQRLEVAEEQLAAAHLAAVRRDPQTVERVLLDACAVADQWVRFARAYVNTHPEVGMGMTYTIWTDREVYEVTRVKGTTKLWARRMRAKRVDNNGMSEAQDYVYVSDLRAPEEAFTFRKAANVWKRVGDPTKQAGGNGRLGYKRAFYDFTK